MDPEQAPARKEAARLFRLDDGSRSTPWRQVAARRLIYDVPIIVSQSKKKPGAYGGVVGQIVTGESYGAVMEKGNTLKPFVDERSGS